MLELPLLQSRASRFHVSADLLAATRHAIKGQGPGLVNVLWAERKTTSFNLWAEAQNDKFLYMPRTHATATLVHQNYFGLVIGDATTTATTTRGHDHRRNDTRAVPSPELLMNTNLFT